MTLKNNGGNKSQLLKQFMLLLFPVFVIFFFIPFEIYSYNIHKFTNNNYLILSFNLVGICLILAISILCFIPKVRCVILNNVFTKWMFLVGAYLLTASLFSSIDFGLADRSTNFIYRYSVNNLLDLVLLFFVLVLGCLINKEKKYQFLYKISIIVIILSCAYFAVNYISYFYNQNKDVDNKQNLSQQQSVLPNIYHIHLDAMQTDFFIKYVKEENLENELKGFTLFKHNVSQYSFTDPSVASYMTSTTYKEGDNYKEWLGNYDMGILRAAKQKGYKTIVFGGESAIFKTNKNTDVLIGHDEIYREHTMLYPNIVPFVSIWLARITPNIFTKPVTNIGKKIGVRISNFANYIFGYKAQNATTQKDCHAVLTAVYTLKDLISTEPQRSARGTYLYSQPILPHAPFITDENGAFIGIGTDVDTPKGYYKQVKYAVKSVIKFIHLLKRLNRFNESMIIIHGDHGEGYVGFSDYDTKADDEFKYKYEPGISYWSLGQMKCRSMALLMIKRPFDDTSKFKIESKPSALIDLLPTMSSALGFALDKKTMEGIDLFNQNSKLLNRELFFHYYQTNKVKHFGYLMKVKFNDDDRPVFYDIEKKEDLKLNTIKGIASRP